MVVSPSSIWITREGNVSTVNDSFITSWQFALAVKLLGWACDYREVLWHDTWAPQHLVPATMEQHPYNLAFEDAKNMINSKANYVHVDGLGVKLSTHGVKKVNFLFDWPRDMFPTTKNAPASVAERCRDEWLLFQDSVTWRDWAYSETFAPCVQN